MANDEIMNENEALSWDGTIEEQERTVPPVGEYNFTVAAVEKTYSKNGSPMVKLTLSVDTGRGQYPIYEYIVLEKRFEWKLLAFSACVGVRKKGEKITNIAKMFDSSVNKEGRAAFKHEDYNGQPQFRLDKFIAPKASAAPTAPVIDEDSLPFRIDD